MTTASFSFMKVKAPSLDLIDQSTCTSRIICHRTIPQLDTSQHTLLRKPYKKPLAGFGTNLHLQAPGNQQEMQMAGSKGWKKDAVHTLRLVTKKKDMNIFDDSEIDVTLRRAATIYMSSAAATAPIDACSACLCPDRQLFALRPWPC